MRRKNSAGMNAKKATPVDFLPPTCLCTKKKITIVLFCVLLQLTSILRAAETLRQA